MKPVIDVKNLSKKYLICHEAQGGYSTLVETMTRSFKKLICCASPLSYEEFWALKDASFQIYPGDRMAIIGKNGAGKSTLLKILSRITPPTEGSVATRGRIASLLEVGTGFHPELTGRENIFLNGAILGMPKREIMRHFDEIVEFSEIKKFLDTPVKHYSTGMYTRLGFSIAAHLDPDILIVDEVLAVGDVSFQAKCLKKLDTFSQEGRTILFVSHNIQALTALCNKAILLKGGKIAEAGTMEACLNMYLEGSNKTVFSWKGKAGDPSLQIYSVELEHENDFFYQNESPLLKISCEVLQPLQEQVLGIEIKNSRQQTIVHSFAPKMGPELGLGRLELSLPLNMALFWEGDYSLIVKYFIPRKSSCIQEEIVLKFTLYPPKQGSFYVDYSHMEGVHIPATWEMRSSNQEAYV
jgi:lipopolysaccharide transport system ATP-binding protein